ncbi:MAG: sialidase family protein [Actinomycetota bacterium]
MRLAGLLAAIGLALVLAAASDAQLIGGTKHADLLVGTLRADRIVARAGNDRINVAGGGADRVLCGPGADLVAADQTDRIGVDCEVVSKRMGTDPYRGGGAQHASTAEPDSFSWGTTVVAAFQVARFSNGGAQSIGFARSTDAGLTWRSGLLPNLTVSSRPAGRFLRVSDPSVAYDALHGLWLVTSLGIGASDTAVLVSSSADGLHWSAPIVATQKENGPDGILLDKEWVACDNGATSSFRGHCYLSYSDLGVVQLVTQTSTDGGKTWGPAIGAPDGAGRRGIQGPFAPAPQPVALPDGTLVVPLFDDEISVVSSKNGGVSFSSATRIAPSTFSRSSGMRAGPFPSAEVGADGSVLMAWPDCAARPRCSGNDLVFSKSQDGLTWTPPVKIPLGPGNHVMDGLAADPARPGRVAVTYYTESAGKLDVRLVWSRDGGATWSRPVLLTPERMPYSRIAVSGGAMVGDYMSTSFADGRAVAVFTLAQSRLRGRLRQATFASSIAVP